MMTAPNMPLAMCSIAGRGAAVVHPDPGVVGFELVDEALAGRDAAMATLGATWLAWKSIEWVIVPSLTTVTLNTSPMWPRRIGAGTWPSNVHACWVTPGATSRVTSGCGR